MKFLNAVKDGQLQVLNCIHRLLLNLSQGKIGNTLSNMPVFRVTTSGRNSGQPHTVLLTAPIHHGSTYVFVASKGGDDRDPDWYCNMLSNPEFILEPASGKGSVTLVARTASNEEKNRLWPQITETYKGYDRYQSRSKRNIPVIIAEPIDN